MKINLIILFISTAALAFSQPMAGTYTIGGTDPDFTTIHSAVAQVVLNGVNGPTNFILRNGTYDETIQFATIPGASAINIVTFTGETTDSNLVLINGATTAEYPNSLRLDFLEYVTFKSLTIRQLANVNNNAVVFVNRGKYIRFEHCVLWGHGSTTSSATDYVIQGCADSGFVVRNSYIRGANEGLSISNGSSISHRDVLIENNNFQTGGRQLFMNGGAFSVVRNNYFSSRVLYQSHSRGQFYGNRVYGTLQIISSSGWADYPFRIYNNQIYRTGADLGATYALRIGSSYHLEIYNNTIAINSTNAGFALYAEATFSSTDPISIINNNIYRIDSNSTNHLFRIPNAVAYAEGIECDYNNFFSKGPNFMNEYPSFTDWTTATGFDAHSTTLNPQIVLGEDLLIANPALFNTGTPISYITTDIRGTSRNLQQPTVGAFEQLTAPVVNLGNDTSICGTAFVLDAGNSDYTYLWSTGETTSSITITTGGTYYVIATNAAGSNTDTLTVGIYPFSAVVISASEDSICLGAQVSLQVIGTNGTGLFWEDIQSSLLERIVSPDTSTLYSGYYINAEGCTTAVEKIIVVYPPVQTDFDLPDTSICSNSGLFIFPDGTPAGGTYLINGTAVSNLNPVDYSNQFVTVTYTYISENLCTTTASDSIYINACTTTHTGRLQPVQFTYDPIHKILYLTGDVYGDVQLKLIDISGRILMNKTMNSNSLYIDIDLTQGVYIIELTTADGISRNKMILN
jgi:hypothetical protein